MPNWCDNRLTVRAPSKKELNKFLKAVKGKHSPLLFSSIRPRPEELDFHTGFCRIKGKECTAWREVGDKQTPVTEEHLQKYIKKYGAKDWYDWSIKNWGTKWDLSDKKDDEEIEVERYDNCVIFSFQTAWSPPVEWCQFAVSKFPNVTLELEYVEEGCDCRGHEIFEGEKAFKSLGKRGQHERETTAHRHHRGHQVVCG